MGVHRRRSRGNGRTVALRSLPPSTPSRRGGARPAPPTAFAARCLDLVHWVGESGIIGIMKTLGHKIVEFPRSRLAELQVRQGEPPTLSSTAAISVSPVFQTWVTAVASALPATLQKHHSRPTSAGNVSPESWGMRSTTALQITASSTVSAPRAANAATPAETAAVRRSAREAASPRRMSTPGDG